MVINKVNTNSPNFQSARLYYISRTSKAGKFIMEVAKEPANVEQIQGLKKHGVNLDFIREFDVMGQKTRNVLFRLSTKPKYYAEDSMHPIKGVAGKVESLEDAKKLVEIAINKSKEFLPTYLNFVKKYFPEGDTSLTRKTIASAEKLVAKVASRELESSSANINKIRQSVYKNMQMENRLSEVDELREAKTIVLVDKYKKQNEKNGIKPFVFVPDDALIQIFDKYKK